MIGKDAVEFQRQRLGTTLWQRLRRGVENTRREMNKSRVTRKEVRAKQKSEPLAVEARMPVGMTWKMNGAQAMPDFNEVAVVQPAVGEKRPERQQMTTHPLQASCDTRPTRVFRMTGVMVRIKAGCRNPRARLPRDTRHIQDVVEVSVGDNDSNNRESVPSALSKRTAQVSASSDKATVEQIQPLSVFQNVETNYGRPDLENI